MEANWHKVEAVASALLTQDVISAGEIHLLLR